MIPSILVPALRAMLVANEPILIVGHPGVAKTDCAMQAANEEGMDIIVSHPVISDPTDFKGFPWVINGKATFLPYGDLEMLMTVSRPTVFFMDDLGQAAPAVQATCMQLLKARRVGEKKISDHVRIIAATNFKSDKAGVFGMLEPVKSRFVSILQLEVSVDDWIKWALANDVPLPLIGFIRWKPDMLHQFKASSDMTNTPSPRTVTNVGKCQNILETAANGGAIDPTLEFEMFKGAAGEAFATEYCGHLQLARAAFDPDAILMDPDNAPIPDSLDMRYAICGAVAMRASQKTAGRIITYANRLPEEFNVLMVRDCQARNQGFQMSKEFKKWFQDHKDVMI